MFALFSVAALLATMVSAAPAPAGAEGDRYTPRFGSFPIRGAPVREMCLNVQQDWEEQGVPHIILNGCSIDGLHKWAMNAGSTEVTTDWNGKKMCMDAAVYDGAHDGGEVRIRECDRNASGQRWFWTGDGRLALEGQNLCLDVREGSYHDGAWLSVWSCITGNEAQHFIYDGTPEVVSSTVVPEPQTTH